MVAAPEGPGSDMTKSKKVSPYGPKDKPVTYKQHLRLRKKAMQKKDRWDR